MTVGPSGLEGTLTRPTVHWLAVLFYCTFSIRMNVACSNQVRDKHETDDVLRGGTVVISEYIGVLTNDDGVNFKYRNVTLAFF